MANRRSLEIAAGVRRLSGGICNFYLVERGGRITLVDAGAAADWKLLLTELAALGRKPDDIEAVLLTHAHADHTGFAERSRNEAGAAVWIHGADADVARGGKQPPHAGGFARYLLHWEAYRTLISLSRRGGSRIVPIAEVSSFADGETVDVPGRPRAVHVPGHTAGSAAILLEDAGMLFTGDALVTRNVLTGRTGPQLMPRPLNQDLERAHESLTAMEIASVTTVLPGHGEPWHDGAVAAVAGARRAGFS
ncbi:MAG: MBL fold metallo-hydrolase [Candidatus Dormibacteraeota bacterium]|nr:MBL fold metallo-hydrolase [Candidatus Dormibacteraeota bacterium]